MEYLNPRIWETEKGGDLWILKYPDLHINFQANPGYNSEILSQTKIKIK